MSANDLTYGLDFGTSNSAIAIMQDATPVVLPIGIHGQRTTPSVLYFPPTGRQVYVGQEAIERYIGGNMEGRFMQAVKTLLPDAGFQGTTVQGFGRCTATDLASFIIRDIKSKADALVNRNVQSVVLGRPALFSDNPEEDRLAEKRLLDAAMKAGFTRVRFQHEPIAAAMEYELSLARPRIVFVADLGGGTSDFTVMRVGPGRLAKRDPSDILAVNGVTVAGNAINSRMMRHNVIQHFGANGRYTDAGKTLDVPTRIHYEICRWERIPFLRTPRHRELLERMIAYSNVPKQFENLKRLIEENLGYRLFQAVEASKLQLSRGETGVVSFHERGIEIDASISPQDLLDAIVNILHDIDTCIDETLKKANLTPAEIDDVFLTGGTSYLPVIRRLLEDKFGKAKLHAGDAFISVVAGLALSIRHMFD